MTTKKKSKGSKRKRQGLLTEVSAEYKRDLREFRKSVAALKKIGVAFQRTAPRKATKSARSKNILAEFKGLLQGFEKASKVTKRAAEDYERAGFKVKNQRVILEAPPPGARQYSRGGKVYVMEPRQGGAIKREIPPIAKATGRKGVQKLHEFLESIPTSDIVVKAEKKGQLLGFRYFGNKSIALFKRGHLLKRYLAEYYSIQEGLASSRKHQVELIEQIEIISVIREKDWYPEEIHGFRRAGRYAHNPEARAFWREKRKTRNPGAYNAELAKNRERAKRWRAKQDPEKLREKERARKKRERQHE